MSLLLVAFIFSFSERQVQSGVPIEVKFPSMPDTPKLATEIYESNPLLDIQVEILNGCGTPGIAAKFSELLRDKRVDVVRSENADHFEYEKTVLIQRNEKIDAMKHVAQVLGFNIQNPEKVRTSLIILPIPLPPPVTRSILSSTLNISFKISSLSILKALLVT